MKASELVNHLNMLIAEHGDLEVRGEMSDGDDINEIVAYDEDGRPHDESWGQAFEFFIHRERV